MDERKKKMAISEIEIQQIKCKDIVWDILNQLPDDAFSEDYSLYIAYGKLEAMFKDLIEVIERI